MAQALQRRKILGPELSSYCFNMAIFMYVFVIESTVYAAQNCPFVTTEYLSKCNSNVIVGLS